jgi:hypothetical protein
MCVPVQKWFFWGGLPDPIFLRHTTTTTLSPFQVLTSYSSKSGRSLLRLYHIFPQRIRVEVVEALCVGSLMCLPEPDFVQVLSLLPEGCRVPCLPVLEELELLLQRAFFSEFWVRARDPEVVALLARTGLAGAFGEAVRGFVAGVLKRTYRRIALGELAGNLGLSEGEARAWVAGKGWGVDASGGSGGSGSGGGGVLVELPPSVDNTPRATKAGEEGLGLKFSDVMSVLYQGRQYD